MSSPEMTKEEMAKLSQHMVWCGEAFWDVAHNDWFCGYHGSIVKVEAQKASSGAYGG